MDEEIQLKTKFVSKIRKTGGTYVVTIPKAVMDLGFKNGEKIVVKLTKKLSKNI